MSEKFHVYQFGPDDVYERVREFVPLEEAVKAARTYTNNVAARIGITRRVIICDMGDMVVFEWKFGEGVVFPKLEA
jgi:hypothetical protein